MTLPTVRGARGVLLGLLVGDAVGTAAGPVPETGGLRAGPGGQLACWTVEGLIRSHVRGVHKGVTSTPEMVWSAYRRWATMRGDVAVDPVDPVDPAGSAGSAGSAASAASAASAGGWLSAVPVMAERRGSAPATLSAVRSGRVGTLGAPAGGSAGAHALTRTLPAGLCPWTDGPAALGAELAATTHAGPAVVAAGMGAALIAALVRGEAFPAAVTEAVEAVPDAGIDLGRALALARDGVGEISIMRGLASAATASNALVGGVYAAAVASEDRVREGLALAAAAGDGGHAATVAGALLGARFGPERLPVEWVSRLELVWVGDTLARDLVREFTESPSGSAYSPADDPEWWDRYPGD